MTKEGRKSVLYASILIIVAYAINCHKSQGLALDSVVVHCSTKFVPGLIYVLSSCARSDSHIQGPVVQKTG